MFDSLLELEFDEVPDALTLESLDEELVSVSMEVTDEVSEAKNDSKDKTERVSPEESLSKSKDSSIL